MLIATTEDFFYIENWIIVIAPCDNKIKIINLERAIKLKNYLILKGVKPEHIIIEDKIYPEKMRGVKLSLIQATNIE